MGKHKSTDYKLSAVEYYLDNEDSSISVLYILTLVIIFIYNFLFFNCRYLFLYLMYFM